MLKPTLLLWVLEFQVGLWSHKWHFEASTSHRDMALFDLGVRPQKARDLQIPDHPFWWVLYIVEMISWARGPPE